MRCPVLVGRQLEEGWLEELAGDARAGRGRTVVVRGEAGVGKSCLVHAVAQRAIGAGMVVLSGRAVEADHPIALRPLIEAVFSALRGGELPDSRELAAFRSALRRLAPAEESNPADAEPPLVVLAEGLLRLIRVLGRDRGGLLILEDLHWSDPDTLAVVEYLADNIGAEPVLICVTLRPDRDAVSLATRLQRRDRARIIEVEPLGEIDVKVMIRACLDTSTVPDELDRYLVGRSEGLPLLVEDLLSTLRGTGDLSNEGGPWTMRTPIGPRTPASFIDAVATRWARLAADVRRILVVAAAIGVEIDWRFLQAVGREPEDEILGALEAGVDADILSIGSGGYRFRHALTRDAVLAIVPRADWIRAAARAAQAMATSGSVRHEVAAELFEAADRGDEAAVQWQLGAREAMGKGVLREAETMLRRARRLCGGGGDLRLGVDEALVEVLVRIGNSDEALDVGDSLITGLVAGGAERDRIMRAQLQLAAAATSSQRWQQALTFLDAADGIDPAAADLLRAQVAMGERRPEDARALALRTLEEATPSGRQNIVCEALEVLGRVARLTDLAEAEAIFERAYRVADANGLLLWRLRALLELATIDLVDWRGDERRLILARQIAMDCGAIHAAAVMDLHLNAMRLTATDLDGALGAINSCVDISRRLRLPTLPKALLHLAATEGLRGDRLSMEAAVTEAKSVAPDDPEVLAGEFGHVRWMVALWHAEDQQALAMLQKAAPIYGANPMLPWPFRGLWALLETALGDGAACREAVRTGPQLTTRYNHVVLAYADAVALGREGRAHDADALFAEQPAGYPANRSWMDRHARRIVAGCALTDGWGEPGIWLRDAIEWFNANNQPQGAAAARRVLRAAGMAAPRPARPASRVPPDLRAMGVTDREMDVLMLVTQGLSNREIAAKLFVSARTVETHVAHLLRRTNSSNRAKLAALGAGAGW